MLTPNGSLCRTRVKRELCGGAMVSPDQCDAVCVLVWNELPHTAKRTPKAVGSHTVCPTPHISVEDGAKTEIRVGRGTSIADLDRAGRAVILSYRSASLLSPFVRFIY